MASDAIRGCFDVGRRVAVVAGSVCVATRQRERRRVNVG